MIDRYSLPEMAAIFTDEAKFTNWLKVEMAYLEALANLGYIPQDDYQVIKAHLPSIDQVFIKQVQDREQITNHDTAAFVDVVQQLINRPEAKWVHFGLTSSDVVDTALSLTLKQAIALLKQAGEDLLVVLKEMALKHVNTLTIGRTHGQHAEPTTFGVKLALWAHQVKRGLIRLTTAENEIAVGKLSGAVGTYSNSDPEVEHRALQTLGLKPVASTQVIARDHHASYIYSCVSICSTIETIALEIRHLARTEVSEVSEAFSEGQKGSSAMPHKRNPILSERLCGLSRIARAYLIPAFENIALWHERDISHSSVERMMFPDVSLITYYLLVSAKQLLTRLEINEAKMLENLQLTKGAFFSQKLLLSLIKKGLLRDDAYRLTQQISHQALTNKTDLEAEALSSKHLSNYLTEQEIKDIFSINSLLKNCRVIVESVKNI